MVVKRHGVGVVVKDVGSVGSECLQEEEEVVVVGVEVIVVVVEAVVVMVVEAVVGVVGRYNGHLLQGEYDCVVVVVFSELQCL